MRFFLLLLAAASACDVDCVGAIYERIAGTHAAGLGWEDADMAVYGYTLYGAAIAADANDGEPEDGFGLVDQVLSYIAAKCGSTLDAITRDEMATCIEGASQEDVDEVQADADAGAKAAAEGWGVEEADAKKWIEGILGAVANQLAPGSAAAGQWAGLTADEYVVALKVYFLVGEFWTNVIPALEVAFAGNEDGKEACYGAISVAVGYTEGGDLAAAIANKGEKAFGEEGLQSAACFGTAEVDGAATVPEGGLTYTPTGGTAAVTLDAADVVTKLEEGFAAGNVKVEKFKAEQPGAETPDDDEEASAAALSAVVALLAMML